jgi:hypothetical protein
MMQKIINFDDMLLEIIEEVLKNIFDVNTAETILHYVNKNTGEKMDARIQFFADSLPKILGHGATIVEDLILETLYNRLHTDLKWRKDYRFIDYIQVLQKEIKTE